jgi:vacuolar-type H+-ATPase subunit I/STV1
MPNRDETSIRHRLRNIVVLLFVVAVAVCGVVFVRALGPSTAVLEQRAADRAAWEKGQTAEQRASSEAWDAVVRETRRQQGLIAIVFLFGNFIIVVTCIRSTRANARDVGTRQLGLGDAFVKVLSRVTVGLGAACAILIVVPILESVIVGGRGMYSGEQGLSAVATIISFLLLWVLSLGLASVVLWRRSRANPLASSARQE